MSISQEQLEETRRLLAGAVDGDGKDARRVLDRVPALIAEVERLRAALRPFAKAARELDGGNALNFCVEDAASIERAFYDYQQPTVGDLRRARAALPEEPADG